MGGNPPHDSGLNPQFPNIFRLSVLFSIRPSDPSSPFDLVMKRKPSEEEAPDRLGSKKPFNRSEDSISDILAAVQDVYQRRMAQFETAFIK